MNRDGTTSTENEGYDRLYRHFDSPAMRRVRQEAYGTDIGQHSWVTAEDLEGDVIRLRITRQSRLLDLGCGPCGPLTFIIGLVGCAGTGIDVNGAALTAGRQRAAALGLQALVTLRESDLDAALPLESRSFDAVCSFDVILHLRDRLAALREIMRILRPGGRFLFTDAGVKTGPMSPEDIARRSIHGRTEFVAPGVNEELLQRAGFQLLESADQTPSLIASARGRYAARIAHRAEVEPLEGTAYFEKQQTYLESVADLARRGALARMMYLAQSRAG